MWVLPIACAWTYLMIMSNCVILVMLVDCSIWLWWLIFRSCFVDCQTAACRIVVQLDEFNCCTKHISDSCTYGRWGGIYSCYFRKSPLKFLDPCSYVIGWVHILYPVLSWLIQTAVHNALCFLSLYLKRFPALVPRLTFLQIQQLLRPEGLFSKNKQGWGDSRQFPSGIIATS